LQPPKAQQQQSPLPTPSSSSSPRKKRKRGDATTPSSSSRHRSRVEENEFLPSPATDDDSVAALGSLDFHELLDEDALRHKFTVVNRAPVMMAWACVVAERLGFSRDEALSIGTSFYCPSPNFPTSSLSFVFQFSFHLQRRCIPK
jgi:hypothetical protein